MRPIRKSVNPKSLLLIGIPKSFIEKDMEHFKTFNDEDLKKVKDFCEDYIANIDSNYQENKGIFFYGSNGVGKSMLSSIILKVAYIHRYTCRRVTFSSYISVYTESWSMKNGDRDASIDNLYQNYKNVEFLVLEEVGKEIDSKIAKPILEDLLRYREENGLVTIICSNVRPSEIEKSYGASVMSLIKGSMIPVKIVGRDMRGVLV